MKESRREFLKKAGGAIGITTLASQMGYFGMVNAFANMKVKASPQTHRALVVIFLAGGNDGNNTVVPKHSGANGYDAYAAGRGALVIPPEALKSIQVPGIGEFGLHPSLGGDTNIPTSCSGGNNRGIHELWDLGKMAIVTNVGTLVRPITKTQFQNGTVPQPFQLFSHADQIEQHQSAISNGTDYKGWGGRISEKMISPYDPLPLLTSVAGSQLFITGGQTPLVVADATTGLETLFLLDHNVNPQYASIGPAFTNLVTPSATPIPPSAAFVGKANSITNSAVLAQEELNEGYEVSCPTRFPNTGLGKQLLQVARLIKLSRETLPDSRKIYFCQLGGFDTHSSQLSQHSSLLFQFSQAVRAFYDEIEYMGASNDVTTFTMSDFNRTFSPNSNGSSAGSDHAWGNHQFVIGGAVDGKKFYGINTPNNTPFPTLVVGGECDTENSPGARGRWIPTTSIQEYAVALARWFGLPESEINYVFPGYSMNFNDPARCSKLNFLGTQPCP